MPSTPKGQMLEPDLIKPDLPPVQKALQVSNLKFQINLSKYRMSNFKFGVLGCGVIGLTTALQIQNEFPSADVTIVADKFNQDTTSDGAAGIFRPGTSFSAHSEEATKFIIKESYKYYEGVLKNFEPSTTGVSQVSGYIFSKNDQSLVQNELIDKIVPLYRPATESELRICPGDWKFGSYFTTVLTECRKFLPWCLQRFQESNGKVIEERLLTIRDVEKYNFDMIFNCLGFGAKDLIKDRKLVPIRGQVFKVSAKWLKNFFYADYDTYIIPGQENVTLGGCRNYGSYDLSINPYDSAAIWDRCTKLVPKLRTCRIEREWVGLRPHRDPVRIEPEVIKTQSTIIKCIHNYGQGGYGVTTAPGSAKLAVNLGIQFLKGANKL